MKLSVEGLSNRVPIIVRIYADHMKLAATFIFIGSFFVIVYMALCFVCFYLIL